MSQVVFLSEGLMEYRQDSQGNPLPPGISGDGVAMAVTAALLSRNVSQVANGNLAQVKMLTAAGADAEGEKIKTFCDDHQIDTSLFAFMPDGKTAGWEFVADPDPIKKKATVYRNRNAENCPIDWLFREARDEITNFLQSVDKKTVFVISGIAASRPFAEETYDKMLLAIREAKSRGALVLVDPNTRMRLFKTPSHPEGDADFARDRLSRLFTLADIALPSFPDDLKPQGNVVFPWDSPEAARDGLYNLGVPNVIVKLADKGSILYRKDETSWTVPPIKIENANTAGAGDAYVGGFALGLAAGLSIERAMSLGTCAAAQKVQCKEGAVLLADMAPTAAQIQRCLTADSGHK